MKKRIISLLLTVAMLLSVIPVMANADAAVTEPSFKGVSLTLDGILRLNVKVDPGSVTDMSGYKVRFTVGDDAPWECTEPTQQSGLYVYTAKIPAHKLQKDVKVELLNAENDVLGESTWTLASYLEYIVAQDSGLAELSNSLNLYATNAAAYATNSESQAPTTAVEQATLVDYKSVNETPDATIAPTAKLLLNDACTIRVQVKKTDWVDGYRLKIDGVAQELSYDETKDVYYCDIKDIRAQSWGTKYAVEIVDSSDATQFKCNYAVMSYVYIVLGQPENYAKEINLLKSMYLYFKAADSYINPELPDYGKYPTANIEDFTNSGAPLTEVTEDGFSALSSEISGDTWNQIKIQSNKLKDLGKFDYVKVRYKAVNVNGAGMDLFFGVSGCRESSTTTDGAWKIGTWRKDATNGAEVFNELANGRVYLIMNAWTRQGVTPKSVLTIAEVIGGYDDIVTDGATAINLTTKLGLTAAEFTASFTPDGGAAVAVTDVASFTPTTSGELTVTVNKEGYKATDFNLKVTCLPVYGKYPTANIEDFTNSGAPLTEVTEDGFSAISCETSGNTWNQIKIQSNKLKDLGKFDYVKVRYKAVNVNGAGMDLYFGVSGCRASSTVTDGAWKIGTWRKDATNGTAAFAELANGRVNLIMNAWTASGVTPKSVLTIAEVIGGYDDIVTDGETVINLTTKLGLTAAEFTASFTPDGGEAAAVTDVASFVPSSSGELTVTVNKEGYMATVHNIAVTVTRLPAYGKYSTENIGDFDSVTSNTGTIEETEGGIKFVATGDYVNFSFNADHMKMLSDMDYITIRFKVSYSASAGSIGLKGTNGAVYNDADSKSVVDGWNVWTWRKDGARGSDIFPYIAQTGNVQLSVYAWNGSSTTVTVTVAEIYGGYDSIESNGDAAIDLTEKLGLSAEEFTATFKPNSGEAAAVENVASFVPSSSGELTVTVNKEGYKATDFKVAVSVPKYPTVNIEDFSSVTGSGTIEETENSIQMVATGDYVNIAFNADYLKALGDMDYITIRFKVSYSYSGGSVGLKGTNGAVYNDADSKSVVDGWNVWTWRKDGAKGSDIFPFIAQNGSVQLWINAWNGSGTTVTVTVAEISGGYN